MRRKSTRTGKEEHCWSRVLYRPWPKGLLASNPLARLREPPPLSSRRWHPGRKARSSLGQKRCRKKASAGQSRRHCETRKGGPSARTRHRRQKASVGQRVRCCHKHRPKASPKVAETSANVSLIGCQERQRNLKEATGQRCLRENASTSVPRRYEGTRMRVSWPLAIKERRAGSEFSNRKGLWRNRTS